MIQKDTYLPTMKRQVSVAETKADRSYVVGGWLEGELGWVLLNGILNARIFSVIKYIFIDHFPNS
eukprot:gene14066-4127_t